MHLTFDKPPKATGTIIMEGVGQMVLGFVFGTGEDCDVLLAENKFEGEISRSHFDITFDEIGRLVLIDHSTQGTAISYGGWGGKHTT